MLTGAKMTGENAKAGSISPDAVASRIRTEYQHAQMKPDLKLLDSLQ